MTEREKFEKAFPAPQGVEWNESMRAYCWKGTQFLCAHQDWWNVWQARATPALPQGVEEWIAANSHPLYFADSGEGFGSEAVFANDLRAYLSGMAIVPVEGFKIEAGWAARQEVIVTAPDGGQQIFWPEDAAHGLMKAMLAAAKEGV